MWHRPVAVTFSSWDSLKAITSSKTATIAYLDNMSPYNKKKGFGLPHCFCSSGGSAQGCYRTIFMCLRSIHHSHGLVQVYVKKQDVLVIESNT